ncbi:hypothetical protein AGABI1DRAFT_108070 [Agaricus bisporus var. burnettii JB137-S8]|uniref:G domain-containing protein n=1 Tax=Agaricus bisporus var. burnettii (strain JB137-S8 / ATCC MYA-4627 / FGSC 10392) TaxID=597362 RepID=K5X3U4_AGABU|nr:uncharacterized protein AGABI1DRAFT_108070 [Agaricus bisporus var. burnettii JB137-S8]EKM77567.1 hypothetical protein AGABI1DRAFT_108070 [Agaricus bisporus var. burnettii JB137-S8]
MGNTFSQLFPDIWRTRFNPEGFEAYRKTTPNGIFIALVGRTGSGMSRLIHDATGSYETNVSPEDHLASEPYTVSIQDYGFTVPGLAFSDFPLYFIDTPGFDYTTDNDEHIALKKLHSWVRRFKPMNTTIDGLIFMHNVSNTELHDRVIYTPRNHTIEDLCGRNSLHKVVFVSSHWQDVAPEDEEKKKAEIDKYWSCMAKYNSEKARYDPPSAENAWKILKPLVMNAQIAREQRLVDELENLRGHLTDGAYLRIGEFLRTKATFLKSIIERLGKEGFAMTADEEMIYSLLNQDATFLWSEVERELNVTELERWMTSGERNQDPEDP